MTPRRLGLFLALGLVLVPLAAALLGPAGDQSGASKSAPGLRKEIISLNYIGAEDMLLLLGPFRGPAGSITLSRDANRDPVLVLSDSPEIVEKMLGLIRQMDVRPAEILFTIELISGTSAKEDKADPRLAADPALKDLRKLMGLQSFALIGSSAVRTSELETAQASLGRSGEYVIALKPRAIKSGKDEGIRVEIRFGYASNNQPPPPLIESVLILEPGKKAVVGVSKPHDPSFPGTDQDRGLILLISATLIK